MYDNFQTFGELLEGEAENYDNYDTYEYADYNEGEGESYESYEARRRRGRAGRPAPRVRTAKAGNPVPRPTPGGFATKAELQATAQKLDARIATNSKAVSTLDGRVRTIGTDMDKLSAAFRKEVADRKIATDALKKGLDESRQLALMLPLLATTTTKTVAGVEDVVIDDGDSMSKILPILLLSGGMGGSGGSGGGGMFGGDNMIATLAIVSAMSNNKK